MKYCQKCGAELVDEAVVCPKCGCAVEKTALTPAQPVKSGFVVAVIAFVLTVLTFALSCIPLIGMLPNYILGAPNLALSIVGLVFSSKASKIEKTKKVKIAFAFSLTALILAIVSPIIPFIIVLFVGA